MYLRNTGRSGLIDDYYDEINDADVPPPSGDDAPHDALICHLKCNEMIANLMLLDKLVPSPSKLSDALRVISYRFTTNVAQNIAGPLFDPDEPAMAGENPYSPDVTKYLLHAHGIFHDDIHRLSLDPILDVWLEDADGETRRFINEALLPRIHELDGLIGEDLAALNAVRTTHLTEHEGVTRIGANRPPPNPSAMHANSVKAAAIARGENIVPLFGPKPRGK